MLLYHKESQKAVPVYIDGDDNVMERSNPGLLSDEWQQRTGKFGEANLASRSHQANTGGIMVYPGQFGVERGDKD
jgi:hypothetical protein